MTDAYVDARAPFAPPRYLERALIADYVQSLGSLLLAALVLAYVLVKSLELLGYPVWLWLHQALIMAAQTTSIRFRIPRLPSAFSMLNTSGAEGGKDKDAQRQTGLGLASLLRLDRGGFLGSGRGSSDVPPGLINLHASCFENSVVQGLASLPSLQDYLSKTTSEYEQLHLRSTNGSLFECLTGLNNSEHGRQYFRVPDNLHFLNVTQHQDAQEYYSKIIEALEKEVEKEALAKRRSKVAWSVLSKELLAQPSLETDATDSERNKKADTPMAGEAPEEEPQNEAPETNPESDSPPRPNPSPLSGLIAQRVACTGCGYSEGLTLSEFNCLTVHLGTDTYRDYDIRDCLNDYTRVERINGVQCTKCTLLRNKKILSDLLASPNAMPSEVARARLETRLKNVEEALEDEDFEDATLTQKCGIAKKTRVESTKTKQQVVARAPKCLALHVNRSVVNEHTFNIFKNHANVLFQRELDLGPWCLGSQVRGQADEKMETSDDAGAEAEEVEEWSSDPNRSLIADANGEEKEGIQSPWRYQLRAVVTHRGGHGSGHYVCYRNTGPLTTTLMPGMDGVGEAGEADQWWLFDDESVYTRSKGDVLAQGNVFMLFYERIEKHAIRAAAIEATRAVAELAPLDMVAGIPLPEVGDGDEFGDLLPTRPDSPVMTVPKTRTPVLRGGSGDIRSPESRVEVEEKGESAYLTPPPDAIPLDAQRPVNTQPEMQPETPIGPETVQPSPSPQTYTPSASVSTPTSELDLSSDADADIDMSVTTDTDTSEPDIPVPARSSKSHTHTPQRMRTAGNSHMGAQAQGEREREMERVWMVTAT
ncbi:hypothetical protein BCR34DRAFT_552559 [Clohesyomyces aquaticus]|uniref:ubiquitinyl hydrolase 1 n=1 Tax=Clohesyomyces aquaticus TaxID=1231657 RepID=A0A1Y2AAS0_9PLEO|nr:hypothetical protein BCR34DRAFT_552559 [Clohesyomyces aquaticus]